jgi:hypothetical protein
MIHPATIQSGIQTKNGQFLARSANDNDHSHYDHRNRNSKGESMELIYLMNFAESKKESPSMKIQTV